MLILAFLLCYAAAASAQKSAEVKVRQGRLAGRVGLTKNGRSFSAFEGIPFAEPPLGERRFKPPVPVTSWQGVRDASKPHNVCPQRDIYRRATLIEGDEDCLYLNVYTPELSDKPRKSYPVMVFFHGGGWLCGGGNSHWYGPEILLDRDVLLVVTNYRLGALGFLSTGDEVVPGNNGMKDQNLALQWVKENIEVFGGDPQRVNIFGESAGGASVQLHMVSPLSRGLFQTAISQSGTAHCLWAVSPNNQAIRHAKQLAESLNCDIESSTALVECLRNIPANDLVAKDTIFMKWDTDPMIPFKPVIEPNLEGAFLTEHPIECMKKGDFAQVPWIIGVNTDDGALRAAGIFGNPQLIDELEEKFDRVVPISLLYDETTSHAREITSKIKEFYFGGAKVNQSSKTGVVDMFTDGWFLNGADEAVRYYLKYSKQPVFYYLFGHRGAASFTEIFGDKENDYGVCHADDLQYMFPVGDSLFPDKPFTVEDQEVAKVFTTLWVNFANTGNPTPDVTEVITEKWLPVSSADEMEYYHIVSKPKMERNLFKERTEFWRSLPYRTDTIRRKDEL